MNEQDKKGFYKPDKADYIFGSIGSVIILGGVVGFAFFENNFIPCAVLLLLYISGIVFHGSHIGYRKAPVHTLKQCVGRLGWLLTMGF